MEFNFEIGNYRKPQNKNLFYVETDKQIFLNENLNSSILFNKPVLHSLSKNVSKQMQDYEKFLEIKLRKKFNC
jgi:hypothetical protein